MTVHWQWQMFDAMDGATVYAVLRLRQAAFIVEQTCPYPDADGRDAEAWHLLGTAPDGALIAYLRLFAPTPEMRATRIGRVVTAAAHRGTGLGRALMQQGLAESGRRWPGIDSVVSAQAHLEAFYASLGYLTESVPYDEDGIAHIDMRRPA